MDEKSGQLVICKIGTLHQYQFGCGILKMVGPKKQVSVLITGESNLDERSGQLNRCAYILKLIVQN